MAYSNIHKLCLQVDTQSQVLVGQIDEIRSGIWEHLKTKECKI